MEVSYFAPHSSRLWFWRLRYRAAVRGRIINRIAAERRPGPVQDHGTAKVPADLAVEFFAKAQTFEHRAETSSDARTMNENLRMAEHYLERSRKADAFAR